MFEVKSLAEKYDFPDLFTVRFSKEKVYIGDTAYPIGQLSVDMLNISKESMHHLKSLSDTFAKAIDQKFFSPKEEKTKDMVIEVQDTWNELIAVTQEFPVIKDLQIPQERLQQILVTTYDEFHEKCHDAVQECAIYCDMFAELAFGWIRIVNDIATFLSYASVLVDLFLERLKYHNPEAYASAYYDFMTNQQVQLEIEKTIPHGLPLISQTHEVGLEFVTMTEKDTSQSFCIAERFVFSNLFSFLQVDLSRGLMIGHAPKKCQNCGKYFLLENGYHVSYCTNIAPGETDRTCRQIGAHKKSAAQTKTPAQAEYQKLYNRLKTRKNRKKISVEEWNQTVAWAQEMKDKAERGEISEWELKEIFERV